MSDQSGSRQVAPVERRAAALESTLDAHGIKTGAFIDEHLRLVEEEWVPRNGARVVARAWTDAAFRQRLLAKRPQGGGRARPQYAGPPSAPGGARETRRRCIT
jgi:Nitrile hydratase, alpha chain